MPIDPMVQPLCAGQTMTPVPCGHWPVGGRRLPPGAQNRRNLAPDTPLLRIIRFTPAAD